MDTNCQRHERGTSRRLHRPRRRGKSGLSSRSSIERARALHKAARKAGAKVVTTTFGGERCISFAAINDIQALFDDEGAKQ